MALEDLLRAIEVEADEERRRADRDRSAAATAIVEAARQEAAAVEAQLTGARRGRRWPRRNASAPRPGYRPPRPSGSPASGRSGRCSAASATNSPRCADPTLTRRCFARSSRRAALRCRRDASCASTTATPSSPTSLAGDLRVVPTLATWGGVELAGDDGRTVRNTLEERLANADHLLRGRFARWLATDTGADAADGP